MSTPRSGVGSRVSAHSRTPSLQLHRLAELLLEALDREGDGVGAAALPLLELEGMRLVVNPCGALERLVRDSDFKSAFEPGESSGFIRDMELPPYGTTAKIGGRLLLGTEVATSKAIELLHHRVAQAIDRTLDGTDPRHFNFDTTQEAFQRWAVSVGEKPPGLPVSAALMPVQFAKEPRHADERAHDVARVFTAIEKVNGSDCLEGLLTNIATKLRREELDEDTIDTILINLRNQRQQETSQLHRLFDFLDDEALARVRLQVSMRLMQAVGEHGGPAFKGYVGRVLECYERFGGPDGSALLLDASRAYGQFGRTDLAEHLRKALFYSCLPVWAEWSAQIFETRAQAAAGFATVREVSYRFRVNGQSPGSGIPAFDHRLAVLRARLNADVSGHPRQGGSLAQLVFLHLVVPFEDGPGPEVAAEVDRVSEALKRDPIATVSELLDSLRRRSDVMRSLADELIRIMQTKSRRVVEVVGQQVDRFTVSIHRNIVDWEALRSMSSATTDVLVTLERGEPTIAWFAHLTISENPLVPGSIASYTVETELKERSLTPAGGLRSLAMSRPLEIPLLPIRFLPFTWRKVENRWVAALTSPDIFDAGRGIDVQYDTRLLTLTKAKDQEKARSEQLRAANMAAFALLTYIVLWEVVRRVRAATEGGSIAAALVRLQPSGKEVSDTDGNAAIYAISQALEKALSREIPVKLQGFVTGGEEAETLRWRKRGALHALLGGQPLTFEMDGSLEKVALVSYTTRPCDSHPGSGEPDGYLFVSRTYQAVRGEKGGVLALDQMLSRCVESQKEFGTPRLILEEISRLGKLGFEHVLLLSHHFGNRHLGRAAERHSPHGTLQFLDSAIALYPNMSLYTLRRDVFPAMRLRKRASSESGFEVTQFADHQEMYEDLRALDVRSLMPVYTFATLITPDERGRPQSGFCTYFFDLEERISDVRVAEQTRQNVLGIGAGAEVLKSLISTLRAVHFMESEKPASRDLWLPVLDPFSWMTPASTRQAGELEIMSRRATGNLLLSFPALLSHVTKVLHKEPE